MRISANVVRCGVEFQQAGGRWHYSGNFFWANCAHVARVPPLSDPLKDSWEAEFFLYKIAQFANPRVYGKACSFNPFHCGVNHYDDLCPRSRYLDLLRRLVTIEKLPGTKPGAFCNGQGTQSGAIQQKISRSDRASGRLQ